jgi:malate permease and related proteins
MQEPFTSSSFQPIDRDSLQSGKYLPIAAMVAVIVVCTIGLTLVNAHDGSSGALAPLALVSVGLQLRLDQLSGIKLPLSIGIAFKPLVGLALVMLVYVGLLRADGNVVQITLFESAMGPMIGASIVAIQHGLNPPLITLLVGVGITASFLSLPLWWYVLQGV